MSGADPLLHVQDLSVQFQGDGDLAQVLSGCSLHVAPGEVLALVGESGSGKSVTSLAVLGLLPQPPAIISAGAIHFAGESLLENARGSGPRRFDERAIRKVRGRKIAIIFQDPMTSLNPYMQVGRQLAEVLEVHTEQRGDSVRRRVIEVLEQVGIPDAPRRIRAYPHELSGGMRQRVMIAMALLCEPDLLIADEPTTALDVTVQAQVLSLIAELQRKRGMALLLITHDLGVVAGMADRVAVMYAGRVVEEQGARGLFAAPAHPYTAALLASIPRMDRPLGEPLFTIPLLPPDPRRLPTGCSFHPRCELAGPRCRRERPEPVPVAEGGFSCCFARTKEGTA